MTNEIHLYGTVGASFWDEDHFTAAQVRAAIEGRDGPLTVRLNSGGGIATEGQAIYTMLVDYPGEVEVVVDGVAASAASLIAMAGDKITMRRGSWMLLHDPAVLMGNGRGTAEDHRALADFLDGIGQAYAEVYAHRSGMSVDAAREIMRKETLMVGKAAVDAGFATQFESETEAAAAAAFDYRLYAHAPEEARRASERLERQLEHVALAAVIAGKPRTQKEAVMADKTTAAAEAPTAEMKDAPAAEAKAQPKPDAPAEPKVAPKAPAPTLNASQISRAFAVAMHIGLKPEDAEAKINAAASYEALLEDLTEMWGKQAGTMDLPLARGAATTSIIRDERDTMRQGVEGALMAQLTRRRDVDGPAQAFMGHSLAEMAAEVIGHRDRIRTRADREQVMMAATHSTSDFPAIFENALNKVLLQRYQEAEPTYRRLARQITFNDLRPHPMVRAGDFPGLQPIGEGGEIKFGTMSDNKEVVAVQSYAVGLRISRDMLINDDLDALSQVVADRGRATARDEDRFFFEMFLSGSNADGPTLLETTRQVFNTTDLTKAGSNAAISVANVSLGRAAMMKKTSTDGAKLGITPAILLVGPDKLTEAQQVVGTIQPSQAANVNPLAGTMDVIASPYITGNAWYLFASPADLPNFIFGFLSGYEAPRMRMQEPFGMQGVHFTVEHDFGAGAVDFRGGWKNAGA